jgi:hypothetical protein
MRGRLRNAGSPRSNRAGYLDATGRCRSFRSTFTSVMIFVQARVVIVNAEPTPFDEIADAAPREPAGRILPALCGR